MYSSAVTTTSESPSPAVIEKRCSRRVSSHVSTGGVANRDLVQQPPPVDHLDRRAARRLRKLGKRRLGGRFIGGEKRRTVEAPAAEQLDRRGSGTGEGDCFVDRRGEEHVESSDCVVTTFAHEPAADLGGEPRRPVQTSGAAHRRRCRLDDALERQSVRHRHERSVGARSVGLQGGALPFESRGDRAACVVAAEFPDLPLAGEHPERIGDTSLDSGVELVIAGGALDTVPRAAHDATSTTASPSNSRGVNVVGRAWP